MKTASARLAILQAMQKLESMGLNRGSSGNLSVRVESSVNNANFSFLVTPSGVPTDQLAHHMMVEVNAAGEHQVSAAAGCHW